MSKEGNRPNIKSEVVNKTNVVISEGGRRYLRLNPGENMNAGFFFDTGSDVESHDRHGSDTGSGLRNPKGIRSTRSNPSNVESHE